MNDFLDIKDIKKEDLISILETAISMKTLYKELHNINEKDYELYKEEKNKLIPKKYQKALKDKKVILLFEKNSTRTRVSFEFAVKELGGYCCVLNSSTTQLSRGESIEDTARVFDQMADCVVIRTFSHERLLKLAEYCKNACVINALTDKSHPCQIMADIMTYMEITNESIENKQIAWYGDVNNMLISWIEASKKLNFKINICCPESLMNKIPNSKNCVFFKDKIECAKNCDIITTDTWVSMGEEKEKSKMFLNGDYKVDMNVMNNANKNAIFLHCLPAYRGMEVDTDVIDNEKYSSIVFQEAGNRLHVQKAILMYCFDKLK